jgi:hypothetical protein
LLCIKSVTDWRHPNRLPAAVPMNAEKFFQKRAENFGPFDEKNFQLSVPKVWKHRYVMTGRESCRYRLLGNITADLDGIRFCHIGRQIPICFLQVY